MEVVGLEPGLGGWAGFVSVEEKGEHSRRMGQQHKGKLQLIVHVTQNRRA